ncbi:MAG: hypothetical protein V1706_16370 [Pseudomonadota bacterium]
MFGIFNKVTQEEKQKIDLFGRIVDSNPLVNRYSYRKNGKFEIIFNSSIGELTDPQNQAKFNLLAHAWVIVWGKDNAELHVGVADRAGFRIEINAAKLYIGHKFSDHDSLLDELLGNFGISRHMGIE